MLASTIWSAPGSSSVGPFRSRSRSHFSRRRGPIYCTMVLVDCRNRREIRLQTETKVQWTFAHSVTHSMSRRPSRRDRNGDRARPQRNRPCKPLADALGGGFGCVHRRIGSDSAGRLVLSYPRADPAPATTASHDAQRGRVLPAVWSRLADRSSQGPTMAGRGVRGNSQRRECPHYRRIRLRRECGVDELLGPSYIASGRRARGAWRR